MKKRLSFIAGDETCLHPVRSDSVEQVAHAFKRLGLEADWIVEAVGMGPAATDNQGRKS
jgi:hypothetical protein